MRHLIPIFLISAIVLAPFQVSAQKASPRNVPTPSFGNKAEKLFNPSVDAEMGLQVIDYSRLHSGSLPIQIPVRPLTETSALRLLMECAPDTGTARHTVRDFFYPTQPHMSTITVKYPLKGCLYMFTHREDGSKIGARLELSKKQFPIVPLGIVRKTVQLHGDASVEKQSAKWQEYVCRELIDQGLSKSLIIDKYGNAFEVNLDSKNYPGYLAVEIALRPLGTYRKENYNIIVRANVTRVTETAVELPIGPKRNALIF